MLLGLPGLLGAEPFLSFEPSGLNEPGPAAALGDLGTPEPLGDLGDLGDLAAAPVSDFSAASEVPAFLAALAAAADAAALVAAADAEALVAAAEADALVAAADAEALVAAAEADALVAAADADVLVAAADADALAAAADADVLVAAADAEGLAAAADEAGLSAGFLTGSTGLKMPGIGAEGPAADALNGLLSSITVLKRLSLTSGSAGSSVFSVGSSSGFSTVSTGLKMPAAGLTGAAALNGDPEPNAPKGFVLAGASGAGCEGTEASASTGLKMPGAGLTGAEGAALNGVPEPKAPKGFALAAGAAGSDAFSSGTGAGAGASNVSTGLKIPGAGLTGAAEVGLNAVDEAIAPKILAFDEPAGPPAGSDSLSTGLSTGFSTGFSTSLGAGLPAVSSGLKMPGAGLTGAAGAGLNAFDEAIAPKTFAFDDPDEPAAGSESLSTGFSGFSLSCLSFDVAILNIAKAGEAGAAGASFAGASFAGSSRAIALKGPELAGAAGAFSSVFAGLLTGWSIGLKGPEAATRVRVRATAGSSFSVFSESDPEAPVTSSLRTLGS